MAFLKDSRRLVASIVDFLDDELKKEGMTTELAESIDVAKQCLHMAYTTTSEDVAHGQKKLVDIFAEACPKPPEKKEVTADDKQEAEKLKQAGNEFMKQEKYDQAIEMYTKAIELNSDNAVYYCNRAAAQTGKQQFALSLTDCKRALEIDSKYSKAHSRMGLTYSKMEMYDEAIKCYDEALKLDPENEGYKKNKKIAEEKQNSVSMPTGNAPQMPDLGAMGGLGGFMNNPMFMNMAQQFMQNPAMKEMAMGMINSMMGGAPPGGSAAEPEEIGGQGEAPSAQPDMAQILQMGQQFAQQLSANNPDLVEQLRGQMGGEADKEDKSSS